MSKKKGGKVSKNLQIQCLNDALYFIYSLGLSLIPLIHSLFGEQFDKIVTAVFIRPPSVQFSEMIADDVLLDSAAARIL
jgi:hypothetical protein